MCHGESKEKNQSMRPCHSPDSFALPVWLTVISPVHWRFRRDLWPGDSSERAVLGGWPSDPAGQAWAWGGHLPLLTHLGGSRIWKGCFQMYGWSLQGKTLQPVWI
jgi:hypothetical protein